MSNKAFYLNGAWVNSAESHAVENPWNGELVAEVAVAEAAHVEEAVATSAAAFEITRKTPPVERADLLARIADGIAARREDFIATLIAEAGKPVTFARVEVERAEICFRQAAHETAHAQGEVLELGATKPGRNHFGLVRRFPLGVILGITPFNFPLNLVAHKVAPAIATGNTMVLKPALKTPLSALLLAEVLDAAGLPAGQINVTPFGHEHIKQLLMDERIKMLSFTGSVDVGWKLKSEAAKLKVALELGGNAAVVIEPDADWRAAIPKVASGAYGYAGQSCISVQRIIVQRGIYEDFRNELVAYIREKIAAGDPSLPATIVGPMINARARDKAVDWIQDAELAGAKLLTPLKVEGASLLHPILIENAPDNAAVSCEEAFAPLSVLQPYDSFEEALGIVNDSAFGLQAGVFTPNITRAFQAYEALDVGGVMINQVPTFRVENMPYGGVKDSGFGREGIRYAMEEMTEPRSLVVNLG